jgi:outer membrane protein OmpA-like peptidoglycan-associated protein
MRTTHNIWFRSAIAAAVAAALFTGCATAPMKPAGSQEVRAKLIALQGDAALSTLAPVALKAAELAVAQAELVQPDLALAAHRVYIADRKVDSARALAQTRFAEQERTALSAESAKSRLDARTLEADLAKTAALDARTDALTARAESAEQKLATGQARSDADAALLAANNAQLQAMELQKQVELLQARPTDRGLVLTLGDTLFATGRSELKSGATANLDRVTAFMNEYPSRTATIEGFTDSMGSEEYNQDLSQRRADSVKGYLVGHGVDTARLSSAGRGENAPVGDNASAEGRQQNRRVEVIISQGDSAPKN